MAKRECMKLFLDTADVAIIRKWSESGVIDGITTNPTTLSKSTQDPKRTILEICQLLPHGDISVEITETEPEKVYQQARAIAALAKNIVVKVPCHPHYYQVIKKLVAEKIRINITLVFSAVQSLLMCKLGVYYISPFVGRLDDNDLDGISLLYDSCQIIETYSFETQVLAASLRNPRHVHEALLAGCHCATVPVEIFEKMTHHILTDNGIELFDKDWKKLGITQFP